MAATGRIVGIVGGLLVVIGGILPWIYAESSIDSASLPGILTIPFGTLAFIFGIVGLILVALKGRGVAIGALVMGILALIFALLLFPLLSILESIISGTDVTVRADYGLYISLVGSVILIIGAGLAFSQAGRAEEMAPPMPYAPGPPMEGPPMGAPPMEEPPMEQPPEPPMVE